MLCASWNPCCAPKRGGAGWHWTCDLPRPPPFWCGDRVQIQQVLINLVLNAIDAANGLPEARRTVAVSVERDADQLALVVRDQGQGIASEHLPRLFDSFFSTKPQGMGLGLSITRTLVEAHGGRIRVESGAGSESGAVFRVEWPAAGDAGTPEPA